MKCLFRGEWKKEFKTQIYGCIYFNEPNSLTFREECPYADADVEKCGKFKEKENNERIF